MIATKSVMFIFTLVYSYLVLIVCFLGLFGGGVLWELEEGEGKIMGVWKVK